MADERVRVKDLPTETTTLGSGDYVALDSPTNGVSKFDLSRLGEAIAEQRVTMTYNAGKVTLNIGG